MTSPLDDFSLDRDRLILREDGTVPLVYWPVTPNFGDLLSPWLFEQMTGHKVHHVRNKVRLRRTALQKMQQAMRPLLPAPNYLAIGSIISRADDASEVWGTGSFGTEQRFQFSRKARYHAVRGPLTRALLRNVGLDVPRVYGDPALLVPYYHPPAREKTHAVGMVLRWSEGEWLKTHAPEGVRIIDLGDSNVEATLDAITACERIVTSSLHGLIIADAYGISNAWLASDSPKGGEFKYFDYFASVKKQRDAVVFDVSRNSLTLESILSAFDFDDRRIDFDPLPLLRACPFLKEQTPA